MLILGREGDDDVLGLEPEVADVAPLPLPPELLSAIRDRTRLLDERGEPEYVLFSEGRAVGDSSVLIGGRRHRVLDKAVDRLGEPVTAPLRDVEVPDRG